MKNNKTTKQLIAMIGILFIPLCIWAQPAAEILVFAVEGDVMIIRGKASMPCKRAEKIIEGDIILVKKGTISLVNRNLKRVSIEKKGSYSYQQVTKKFELANASITNRFLVQVLDKMTNKTEQVAYAGGVVRGFINAGQPVDSATILSDSVRFVFANPAGQKFIFSLQDEKHHTIFRRETTDSLLVLNRETASWWKPGNYYWEAGIALNAGTSEKYFSIPVTGERNRLLAEYHALERSFSGFPLRIKNELMDEVLKQNRWVMY